MHWRSMSSTTDDWSAPVSPFELAVQAKFCRHNLNASITCLDASLPPHCSHKLQPLDVSFMKPLSTFYDQECKKWLRQHPGRVITMFQLGAIFGSAYMRAATPLVAENGFNHTGIFPVLKQKFAQLQWTDLSLKPRFLEMVLSLGRHAQFQWTDLSLKAILQHSWTQS